jgi:multidrug efflux pump subunit AcrA (membrane-fusion protein)
LALFPGMTADAHIITAESRDVLRVPLPALRFNPEGFATRAHEAEGGRPHPGSTTGDAAPQKGAHGHGGAPRGRLWLLRAGKLVSVRVRTGLDDGTLIEVSAEELKEGDTVVVNAVRPEAPKESNEPGNRPGSGNNTRQGGGGGGPPRL